MQLVQQGPRSLTVHTTSACCCELKTKADPKRVGREGRRTPCTDPSGNGAATPKFRLDSLHLENNDSMSVGRVALPNVRTWDLTHGGQPKSPTNSSHTLHDTSNSSTKFQATGRGAHLLSTITVKTVTILNPNQFEHNRLSVKNIKNYRTY